MYIEPIKLNITDVIQDVHCHASNEQLNQHTIVLNNLSSAKAIFSWLALGSG